jgi:hypothetical protein
MVVFQLVRDARLNEVPVVLRRPAALAPAVAHDLSGTGQDDGASRDVEARIGQPGRQAVVGWLGVQGEPAGGQTA